MLPGFIRRTRLVFYFKRIAGEPDFLMWKLKGSPRPKVPHLLKQRTVREYGERFGLPVLIETGTQYGQMVNAMRKRFREIYTIELDDTNYSLAVRNFARHKHIHVLHGDSAVELPKLLQSIAEPCLFWLDGHSDKTPIMDELRAVFSHKPHRHVVLIDDARCFGSSPYYPTLDAVRELAAQLSPGSTVESRDNIIRIHN
jgi:16S rRNA A1518/A1519 N6-dimethyltransferase RsmA/KsgA/DIM1 with predicted DNA glycosylase/AP lyase activity